MKVKNTKVTADTWVGQEIQSDTYYVLQASELHRWQNDSKVLSDIGSGNLIVNNDVNDILDVSGAINCLLQKSPDLRDIDGALLTRTKITTTGWHYQLHGIEFATSNISSVESKKVNGTNYDYCTMKYYELINDVETLIAGADLNQSYLDLHCIKTIVDWEPNHDTELLGGMLKMFATPAVDVRLWVVGVPDIPGEYGGSKPFVTNVNLKYVSPESGVVIDGRAPKFLMYNANNHTNKLRLIFRHPVGYQHNMHMLFELFKA